MTEPIKHRPVFLKLLPEEVVVTSFCARMKNSRMVGYVVPEVKDDYKMHFYHYRYIRDNEWMRTLYFVSNDDIVYLDYVDAVEEFE